MKKGTLNPENFISLVQVPLVEHIIEFYALKLLFDFFPINARKPLKYQGFSLSNNPKFQARFRVMSFVLAKNVYSLIKALYW